MPSKNDAEKKRSKTKLRVAVVVVCVASLLWFAIDISGVGGNIRFYSKWVECGRKPVVARINIGSVSPKGTPSYYEESPAFSLVRLSPDQFCTPIAAERAGYSADANNWSFPNLLEAGEDNPYL